MNTDTSTKTQILFASTNTETWVHCSPEKITKITQGEYLTNDTLFFACEEYSTCFAQYVYTITLKKSDIISVSELYDEEIINRIYESLEYYIDKDDISKEDAKELSEDLLDASIYPDDLFFLDGVSAGDMGWELQAMQSECARKMGYIAARGEDEQGEVLMVSLFEREHLLEYSHEIESNENLRKAELAAIKANAAMIYDPATGTVKTHFEVLA